MESNVAQFVLSSYAGSRMLAKPRYHQRGMALIVVLWLLVALSLVATRVVATQRAVSRQTYAELQRSKALLAAEGGIAFAVHQLLSAPERFAANGHQHSTVIGDVKLAMVVRSERGKLDLNTGNLDYFSRFFRTMGASADEANKLSRQMREGRERGVPLQHLEDVLARTSMDALFYQRILPYITIWGRGSVPDAAYADTVLVQALDLPEPHTPGGNPGSVVGVEIVATLANGFSAGLLATVLIIPVESEAGVFRVLRWQEN